MYVSNLNGLSRTCRCILVERSLRYDDGYGNQLEPSYSDLKYLEIIRFDNYIELENWIIEHNGKENFQVFDLNQVPFTVKISLKLENNVRDSE